MRLTLSRQFLQVCFVSLLLGMLSGLWLAPNGIRADEQTLYFASTGHLLTNQAGFLSYWQSSYGPVTLGAPVTEVFEEDGRSVQYFERGRLELHPEYNNAILRGRLGAEYGAALYRSFSASVSQADQPGQRFFSETGHTLGEPFAAFWENYGGIDTFGLPISQPEWEYVGSQMLRVQYFERARLEYQPLAADPSLAVQISPLGRDLALLRGLPTTPVEAQGAVAVDAQGLPLPLPTATPIPPLPTAEPVVATTAPVVVQPAAVEKPAVNTDKPAAQVAKPAANRNGKHIIVDLSDQWLYAYNGEELVYDAPVSTGKDGFNTPVGTYAVYAKLRSQTMEGNLGGEYYKVPNVPHVMYIVGGVALHGTYWHNDFGTGIRRSHGCINLPQSDAAWLYEWAPMGTTVSVRW